MDAGISCFIINNCWMLDIWGFHNCIKLFPQLSIIISTYHIHFFKDIWKQCTTCTTFLQTYFISVKMTQTKRPVFKQNGGSGWSCVSTLYIGNKVLAVFSSFWLCVCMRLFKNKNQILFSTPEKKSFKK